MRYEILNNIYWVGAVDWNARSFHGFTYSIHRGTSYNAYLIVDEHPTLVDTVRAPFAQEMIGRIAEILDPSTIKYIVANHVEPDHSGSIAKVLELCPQATVVGTQKCQDELEKHYFGNWDFHVVRTGDELNLGTRTLSFIEAPMLHWPDSMFTYIAKDALLLPNDAFGQHLATSTRFDDEVDHHVLMEEAAKYYANILWPFSSLVIKKIEDVQKLDLRIEMIAPSHGVVWRSDPAGIMDAYLKWAQGDAQSRVLIVYDTMWGSTEKMAKAMLEGITSEGVDAKLFRLPVSDRGDIIGELLDAKVILIGSSTINNGVLPTLSPFLEELRGLRPRKKLAAAFGSYGWGGGATRMIEAKLREAGMEIVASALTCNWVPTEDELQACYAFGKEIAGKVK